MLMIKVNDFARELIERYGLSPDDATAFINDMFEVVKEELDATDSSVKIKGFGTFKVSAVGARASVDVNTGERIIIDGRNKITFTPEVLLRDRVNRPFVQFETVPLNDGVDFSELDAEESDVDGTPEDSEESVTEETPAVEKNAQDDTSSEPPPSEVPFEETQDNIPEEKREEVSVETEPTSVETEPIKDIVETEPSPADNSDRMANEEINDVEKSADESDEESTPNESPARAIARKLMAKKNACLSGDDCDVACSGDADDDEYEGIKCKQRSPRLMYVLTIASFLLLVVLGIGMYFLYMRVEEKNNVIGRLETKISAQVDSTHWADSVRQTNSAHPTDTAHVTSEGVATPASAPTTALDIAKDTAVVAKAAPTAPSDYNYDVRVRTGAYIIVGVATTVIVKSGQTLSSISKAHLGEGMECYVEALNNCKQVKPGDKLKIPQLKLKPRRR